MNDDKIKSIRDQFGYDGKSLQWQQGFDAFMRHYEQMIKEENIVLHEVMGYVYRCVQGGFLDRNSYNGLFDFIKNKTGKELEDNEK